VRLTFPYPLKHSLEFLARISCSCAWLILASCSPRLNNEGKFASLMGLDKVTSASGPLAVFRATPTLLGGGSTYTIQVDATDPTDDITTTLLEFSGDGGSTWSPLSTSLAPGAQSFNWTVPSLDTSTARLRYRVTDATQASHAVTTPAFSIDSTNPSVSLTNWGGGAYGSGGASSTITFTASDVNLGATPIALDYSTDAGSTWTSLLASQANSGSLSITLPSVDSNLVRFRVTATDQTGRTASAVSATNNTIDSTNPSVTLTNWAGGQLGKGGASSTVTFTVSDANLGATPITLDYSIDGGGTWTNLLSNQASTSPLSITLPSVDSTQVRFRVTATDQAGRTASSSSAADFTLDNTPPSLSLASFNGGEAIRPSTTQSIPFSASDANGLQTNSLSIERSANGGTNWTSVASGQAITSPYSWAVGALGEGNQYRLRLSITDAAGWTSTATSTASFTIDGTPPSFTAASFSYAGGSAVIFSRFKPLAFSATDALSNISHFCPKMGSGPASQPPLTDPCWVPVTDPLVGGTPGLSFSLSNYTFPVGVSSGSYVLTGFIRDAAGNISSLSNSGIGTTGTDRYNVSYNPGSAPTFSASVAASVNTPSTPPTSSDLTSTSGVVFIKWSLTDDQTLPASPITLSYTTDDSTYTTIASGLAHDSDNATACTTDGTYSGCYRWATAPTSGYLRIRITATDADGMATYNSPSPLNVSPPINFLAGNVESNLGASATTGTISFTNASGGTTQIDPNAFAVAQDGTVYVRDSTRGILRINPADSNLTVLLPYNAGGSDSYEGPVSGAVVKLPYHITLDWQDRLLIHDYSRIRRYDPATGNITNVIGGGASTANGTAAASFDLGYFAGLSWAVRTATMFIVDPQDNIYFARGNNTGSPEPYIYSAASGTVRRFAPTGTGTSYGTGVSLADCNWANSKMVGIPVNLVTSSVGRVWAGAHHTGTGTCNQGSSVLSGTWIDPSTLARNADPVPAQPAVARYIHSGRDGRLYAYDQDRVLQYNEGSNTWSTVLGTGTVGACTAGTAATSCAVSLQYIWVSRTSELYFADNHRIRVVDSGGTVRDLYGQSSTFGDGGPALAARFGTIREIAPGLSGFISLTDSSNYLIREFQIGGNITTIAGNGSYGNVTTGIAATSSALQTLVRHVQDTATGDIYQAITGSVNGVIGRLNRSTGQWSNFIGTGATLYESADGLSSTAIQLNGYPAHLFAFNGSSFLGWLYRFSTTNTRMMLKEWTLSGATQSHVAGTTADAPGSSCASGTAGSACFLHHWGPRFATWDAHASRWVYLMTDAGNTVQTLAAGGTVSTLATLSRTPFSMAVRHDGSAKQLYYCADSGGQNYRLYKYNVDTSTETALSWPISGITCDTATRIWYDSGRNSIIFVYRRGGNYGIAEYVNP
jgi:hypothetical protein